MAFHLAYESNGKKALCKKCGNNSFVELGNSKVGCSNSKCRQVFLAIGLSSTALRENT